MKYADRRVADVMRGQMSLITLPQARAAGLTERQVRGRVGSGVWVRVHGGVYAPATVGRTPARALLAACLAVGHPVAASHLSAAWILKLVRDPPDRPTITVPYGRSHRLAGVQMHRSRDLDPSRLLERNGIWYTDPLRTLTDLAAELPPARLSPIVDGALASGMVTTEGLVAEVRRRRRPGRPGPNRLAGLLETRGLVGGPEPSVLEAEVMRLFRRWRIPVLKREVLMGSDGRYRIDFLITPTLVVEVDGFVHHWSPEAKAYDDTRRNRLRLSGVTVLVYDWRAVRSEERRVALEVRAALAPRPAGAWR